MILAVLTPVGIFAGRRRVDTTWGKITSILVCLAGLAWGILDFALLDLDSSLSR
jgi:hypothetical protein